MKRAYLFLFLLVGCHSSQKPDVLYQSESLRYTLEHLHPKMHKLRSEVYTEGGDTVKSFIPLTYHILKSQVADLQGDDYPEVLFCIRKKSKYHPIESNRIFIYGLKDQRIYPIWLGSRVQYPVVDFTISSEEEQDRVLVLQRLHKKYYLSTYALEGFGLKQKQMLLSDVDSAQAFTEFRNYANTH